MMLRSASGRPGTEPSASGLISTCVASVAMNSLYSARNCDAALSARAPVSPSLPASFSACGRPNPAVMSTGSVI
jgi:hypothetical protein